MIPKYVLHCTTFSAFLIFTIIFKTIPHFFFQHLERGGKCPHIVTSKIGLYAGEGLKQSERRIEVSSYATSLVHVLPVTVLTLVEISTNDLLLHHDWALSLRSENSDLFRLISAYLAGYMIYDFISILTNQIIFNKIFLFHHSISFIGAVIGVFGYYELIILPYYLGEIPVIFVNILTIQKKTGYKAGVQISEFLAGLSFILFRLAWTPILPIVMYNYCYLEDNCTEPIPLGLLVVVFFCLSALNYYWFYCALFGGSESTKEEHLTSYEAKKK